MRCVLRCEQWFLNSKQSIISKYCKFRSLKEIRKFQVVWWGCYKTPLERKFLGGGRVFNKSQWPAKFAGYFTWTHCLLFLRNYPSFSRVLMRCHLTKKQNLLMSVFCSNTLIFSPESWNEVQISKFFQKLAPSSSAFATFFFLLHELQSFYHGRANLKDHLREGYGYFLDWHNWNLVLCPTYGEKVFSIYLLILCSGQVIIIVHYHNQKHRLPILSNDVRFWVGIVKICFVRLQGIWSAGDNCWYFDVLQGSSTLPPQKARSILSRARWRTDHPAFGQ